MNAREIERKHPIIQYDIHPSNLIDKIHLLIVHLILQMQVIVCREKNSNLATKIVSEKFLDFGLVIRGTARVPLHNHCTPTFVEISKQENGLHFFHLRMPLMVVQVSKDPLFGQIALHIFLILTRHNLQLCIFPTYEYAFRNAYRMTCI